MADQENTQSDGAGPQPIPVFDVSCDHVYHGGVPKPFFVFLWAAVAFIIGALLPWGSDAEAPMGLLQVFVLLGGLVGTWGCLVGIRSRRLAMGGVMLAEMIAVLAVAFFAKWTLDEYQSPEVARLESQRSQLQIDMNNAKSMGAPKGERQAIADTFNEAGRALKEARGKGPVCDILVAPMAVVSTDPGSDERRNLMESWNTFGTGFYLVALDVVFLFIFLLISIVLALTKGKKAVEPVRRKPRRSGEADDKPADADGGEAASL